MKTARALFFHVNLALLLLLLTGCAAGQGLPGLLILSCLLLFFTQCSGLLLKEDTLDDFLLRRLLLEVKANSSASASTSAACSNTVDYTQSFDLSTVDPATAGIGFTISGENSSDFFDASVSGRGDFNGDGINDIAVGAGKYNGGHGRAYVLFGKNGTGADLNTASMGTGDGIHITGYNNDYLGGAGGGTASNHAIDFVGDVNGDGFDDLIIGAYYYNSGAGAAYLIFGSASPANVTLSSLTASEGVQYTGGGSYYTGASVAGLGDINGDGLADFAIGNSSGSNGNGEVNVVYGKTSGFSTPVATSTISGSVGFTVKGGSPTALGWNTRAAGDMNQDGINDVLIGATQSAGAAYVIYGMSGTRTDIDISSSLSAADGYKITGTGTGFGYSNAGEGDFNGDGINDFATASFQYSSNKGQTALFFGDVGTFSVASMTASEGFRIGPTSAYFSARSIALSGDVNGDGYDDLFIGAPRTNYSASTAGSAYLVFGRADVPSSTDLATYNGGTTGIRIDGTTANEKFANAVALADINGDGCSDMIMGSAWGSIAKTYVIFGGQGQ